MNYDRRSSWALRLFMLLLGLILFVGCWQKSHANSRIQKSREALESWLHALQQNDAGSSSERLFFIKHVKAALTKLDNLPGQRLSTPIPIYAFIAERTESGKTRYILGLDWLEDGFVVNGFYLSDKDGRTKEYPATLFWNRVETEFLEPIALRENGVPVVIDPLDTSSQRTDVPGRNVRAVLLHDVSWNDFREGTVRLGLMTGTGREESTVIVGFCSEKQ